MNKKIQAWRTPHSERPSPRPSSPHSRIPVGMIELDGTALDQVSGGGKKCGSGSGGSGKGSGSGGSKKSKKSKKSGGSGSGKGSGKGC